MSGPSTYQPQNAVLKWLERRLPIIGLVHSSFIAYPTPRNLNYWWTFGGILTFMLAAQIVTGIVLVMHYTPHADMAFNSVEHIMRDVNYGWLIRYLHSNGASMFFVAVYIHMFRGLYYGSYKEPREVLWILGVILYLLMMATGFLGYTLPWGQMSFWGATVITNFFSAIPIVGESIVTWLWGGYSVGNPTLQRFFSLHYLFALRDRRRRGAAHLGAACGRPEQPDRRRAQDREGHTVAFTPYATVKDSFGMTVFCIVFAWFVFYLPDYLGHADNYIPANPAVTPQHIVPEWYYLPFLRDPARHPEQAPGRDRAVRLDRHPGLPALARHLAGAVGELPAAVPAVLLDLRRGLSRARLARQQAPRRRLCVRRAASDPVPYLLSPTSSSSLPLLGFIEKNPSRCRTRFRNRSWPKSSATASH